MAKKTKMQKKMARVRSFRGKKGHTHRSKKVGKQVMLKHPIVTVEIPKNAILKVKRKAHNPYMFKTHEFNNSGQEVREDVQYTGEYRNPN